MLKFFRCNLCGKVVAVIEDSAADLVCCGEPMTELVPGSVDASVEKHVPHVTKNGNDLTVQVGSEIHPMLANHRIDWVVIETNKGCQMKRLRLDSTPVVHFAMEAGEQLEKVYAYCNVHGLWVK